MTINHKYTKQDVRKIAKEYGFPMSYVEGHKGDLEGDYGRKLTWDEVAEKILNKDF